MSQHVLSETLATEQGRRRALTVALNLVKVTRLEPKAYERLLLEQFVRGELTLDTVIHRLEVQQRDNPVI